MTTRRAVLSFFSISYNLLSPIYTLAEATALGTKREERKFLSFLRYNKPIECAT